MALIHTALGALPVLTNPLFPSPPPNVTEGSRLSQAFNVAGGSLYTVQVNYNFITNEFPNQGVDDVFRAIVTSPSGTATQLALESRLTSAFQTSSEVTTVSKASRRSVRPRTTAAPASAANTQWVPETSGTASLSCDVCDRDDTIFRLGRPGGRGGRRAGSPAVLPPPRGQPGPQRHRSAAATRPRDPDLRLAHGGLLRRACDAGRPPAARDRQQPDRAVEPGGRDAGRSLEHVLDRSAGPSRRGRLHLRRRGRPDVRSLRHHRRPRSGDRPDPRHAPPPPAFGFAPRHLQCHRSAPFRPYAWTTPCWRRARRSSRSGTAAT